MTPTLTKNGTMHGTVNGTSGTPLDLSAHIPTTIPGYLDRPQVRTILTTALSHHMPVMLMGDAASGKTSMIEQLHAGLKRPLLAISYDTGVKVRDLIGGMHLENGQTVFRYGLLTKFLQSPATVLLDEISTMDPSHSFLWHQVLQSRQFFIKDGNHGHGEMIHVHPECWIVACGNPQNNKYNGTTKFNLAFAERFAMYMMPSLTRKELQDILSTMESDHDFVKLLLDFYMESCQLIMQKGLRCTFSLRHLQRILLLKRALPLDQALFAGFLHSAGCLAGVDAYTALQKIAVAVFGKLDTSDKKTNG